MQGSVWQEETSLGQNTQERRSLKRPRTCNRLPQVSSYTGLKYVQQAHQAENLQELCDNCYPVWRWDVEGHTSRHQAPGCFPTKMSLAYFGHTPSQNVNSMKELERVPLQKLWRTGEINRSRFEKWERQQLSSCPDLDPRRQERVRHTEDHEEENCPGETIWGGWARMLGVLSDWLARKHFFLSGFRSMIYVLTTCGAFAHS